MTYAVTIDEMRALNGYELSDMAGCQSPDSLSSEGARFLECVRDAVAEKITSGSVTLSDFNDNGQLSEISDNAPSVYTHARWRQFVDLGAYSEDPEITDEWPKSLTEAAGLALYQIADRLAYALCEAWRAGWTCPTCTAEADEFGCSTEGEDGCANPGGALAGMVAERLADMASNGPEADAEALPVRTRGLALAQSGYPVSDVLAGPVPVSDPILTLLDRAEHEARLRRLAEVVRIEQARQRRVRRRVRVVLAVVGVVALVGLVVVLTV